MKILTPTLCVCAVLFASSAAFASPLPKTSKTNPGREVSALGAESAAFAAHDGSAANVFFGTLIAKETPEPASLVLLGTGLAGAAVLVSRKRKTVAKRD